MTARRAFERAQACFRLADHPNTGAAEREAALTQGRALAEKYGLQLDSVGRPIAGMHRYSASPTSSSATLADIFGSCVGCGAVALVGSMCAACYHQAQSAACRHGRHGYCLDCDAVLG